MAWSTSLAQQEVLAQAASTMNGRLPRCAAHAQKLMSLVDEDAMGGSVPA